MIDPRVPVVAKVLYDRVPDLLGLADCADAARAILGALEEWDKVQAAELHEAPATLLSVEQQIRLGDLGYLTDGGTPLEYDDDDPGEVARLLAPVADPLVAWVATGVVPTEPAGASE